MVISEATSKDRRRSSVSPIRERVRRKPRQDWLVTVGQGHSPARTLRRESRGRRNSKSPRTKKFDSARLSFGGLEQVSEVLTDRGCRGRSCAPMMVLCVRQSLCVGLPVFSSLARVSEQLARRGKGGVYRMSCVCWGLACIIRTRYVQDSKVVGCPRMRK